MRIKKDVDDVLNTGFDEEKDESEMSDAEITKAVQQALSGGVSEDV